MHPRTHSPLLKELRKIAPSISFSVSYEPDPDHEWDGDGPDPREEGFEAYDVDVAARAIVDGEDVVGSDQLGGTYERPGKFDPDIGGYLSQMLRAAVDVLRGAGLPKDLDRQAAKADAYLEREAKRSYEAQRRGASR